MVHSEPSVSVAEHRERILDTVDALPAELVALRLALGRVAATDVAALVDVPGFDNSAMDGYAVRRDDLIEARPEHPVHLPVVADLAAGTDSRPDVTQGTAARIMTGAPVPPGADAIVPIELTDEGTETVEIRQCPAPSAHIRPRGTDVRVGDAVLAAGTRLTERHVAAVASVGLGEISVHRRPRVAIISTGSELRPAGADLRHGQIHDSNSLLLAAAVTAAGGETVHVGSVPDDEEALHTLLAACAEQADAIVLSGGVSVGAYDVVKAVLSPLPTMRFHPVRMQPGKPQGFGTWTDGTPIFALPGNPVSAYVSFEVFVRPALRRMQGLADVERPRLRARTTSGWRSHSGRAQYMPVRFTGAEASGRRIEPATSGGSGSYLVARLARAEAIAIVPEEVAEVRAGDELDVMVIDA